MYFFYLGYEIGLLIIEMLDSLLEESKLWKYINFY